MIQKHHYILQNTKKHFTNPPGRMKQLFLKWSNNPRTFSYFYISHVAVARLNTIGSRTPCPSLYWVNAAQPKSKSKESQGIIFLEYNSTGKILEQNRTYITGSNLGTFKKVNVDSSQRGFRMSTSLPQMPHLQSAAVEDRQVAAVTDKPINIMVSWLL